MCADGATNSFYGLLQGRVAHYDRHARLVPFTRMEQEHKRWARGRFLTLVRPGVFVVCAAFFYRHFDQLGTDLKAHTSVVGEHDKSGQVVGIVRGQRPADDLDLDVVRAFDQSTS